MNKALVICGLTATGKTNLGVYIAKKYNGEIVSADSRQVYKGLDIITGKDLKENSKFISHKSDTPSEQFKNPRLSVGYRLKEGIPIWLVDIVDPDYLFNIREYTQLAQKVMSNIWARNKLPIIIGGTGLYIKSLINPLPLIHIPPDLQLRKRLNKLSREKLAKELQEINIKKWQEMNLSDRQNPRRLIRAIEITKYLQNHAISINIRKNNQLDTLVIGLSAPLNILYKRIDDRVEERVHLGAEKEIRKLLHDGFSWDYSILKDTIGYKHWRGYFDGTASKNEVVQQWKYAEHAYARRQITWFKKEKAISWFNVLEKNYVAEMERKIRKWYTKKEKVKSQI